MCTRMSGEGPLSKEMLLRRVSDGVAGFGVRNAGYKGKEGREVPCICFWGKGRQLWELQTGAPEGDGGQCGWGRE